MRRLGLVMVVCLSAGAKEPALQVLYTGKLLGYGRACDIVRLSPTGDTVANTPLYSANCAGSTPYSSSLDALIRSRRSPNSLLLGMGNHFGLDFGSRMIQVAKGNGGWETIDKDELLYFDPAIARSTPAGVVMGSKAGWMLRRDFQPRGSLNSEWFLRSYSNGNVTLPDDAVADWLVRTGYRAMVPGKHDFYFGPEKFREISRLMARGGVHMLGANLIISAKRLDPPEKRLDYMRKRDYLSKHPEVKIKLPKKVLPWIRTVKVDGVADSNGSPQVSGELKLFAVTDPDTVSTGAVIRVLKQRGMGANFDIDKNAGPLTPGSYHACLDLTGSAKPLADVARLCSLLQVENPYFQYSAAPSGVTIPAPYLIASDHRAVVMGVVQPGLEKLVGRIGSTWLDEGGKYDLRMETTDAVEALEQMLDYCRDQGDCVPERRLILLAQMPGSAARSVNVKLKRAFALVIADASIDTGTPLERATYAGGHPALTVAPLPPYDPAVAGNLSVHVQEVLLGETGCTLTEEGGCLSTEMTISKGYRSDAVPISARPIAAGLVEADLKHALAAIGLPMKAGKIDGAFKTLTLALMLKHVKASVAIGQTRDFFETERRLRFATGGITYPDQLLEAVSGILWKGDFVVSRLVKGSALVKMMERSKTFNGEDISPYDDATESGRGLEVIGIVQDAESEKWMVDGAPIESDKAYKVATTDFLGGGDTGYPELAAEVAPPRVDRLDLQSPERVWELVYFALQPAIGNAVGRNWSTYIPYLHWTPFQAGKDPTYRELFKDYFSKRGQPVPTMPGVLTAASTPLQWAYEKPLTNSETLTQWRPLWRLMVEKSGFSLNRYAHNQGDQTTLLKSYEGMPDSRVVAANASSWGWEWAAEVRRERVRSMSFLRTEGTYQRTEVQSKSDNRFARNYPQNEGSLEGGYRFSFDNNIRQTPWIGLLISGLWTTQISSPRSNVAVAYAVADTANGKCAQGDPKEGKCSGSYDARIGKTERLLAKIGMRREGRDYWIEAGYTVGAVGRPIGYSVTGENGRSCDLREQPVSDCLKGLTVDGRLFTRGLAISERSTRAFAPESGVFLNFKWTIPVSPSGKKNIELTNRGRYYFDRGSDIWFDTRLSNVFNASFTLPLAGGLTFKPTWTLFHFKGKGGARIREGGREFVSSPLLMGNTVELKLNYSFDWRAGQPLLRVMRHGSGK